MRHRLVWWKYSRSARKVHVGCRDSALMARTVKTVKVSPARVVILARLDQRDQLVLSAGRVSMGKMARMRFQSLALLDLRAQLARLVQPDPRVQSASA